MAYAVPHYSARPTGAFPVGRGFACHQPNLNNPGCPIANIFSPTGDIGGRGRGKESEGKGERPQGPAVGMGEKSQRGRMEWECSRTAARKVRDREEYDNCMRED